MSSSVLSATDADNFWLIFGAVLVFMMQAGFAMLEVGTVQRKNTKNILIKNVFDASIGAITFWIFGYGFAFGSDSRNVIGGSSDLIGLNDIDGSEAAFWLFQWAFAATGATIVSGAVAERVSFGAYLVYSVVITIFIYPVVVHWVWADGWASAFRSAQKDELLFGCGTVDFAGSGVVHMTGGVAAFIGSWMIGPRKGRFNPDGTEGTIVGQSPIFQTLGTLILWVGWYGFNCVSTLVISGGASLNAGRTAVTTTIAAATGCLVTTFLGKLVDHQYMMEYANNGILSGLVAITAGCSTVEFEGAFVIGVISAFVYMGAHKLLIALNIDDVVDASPVHGFNGAWGVIAAGLFASRTNYAAAYYADYSDEDDDNARRDECCGAFYGCPGSMFGANFVLVLAIIAWVGIMSFVLFFLIDLTIGLRVPEDIEEMGMDASKHGGSMDDGVVLTAAGGVKDGENKD